MNSSDQSPQRLDRVKQVLADSYPQVSEKERESLPASVLEALGEATGGMPAERSGETWLDRLLALFRGPQLVGLGAAAVLVVAALFLLNRGDNPVVPGGVNGGGTRSPGGTVSAPALIVMHALSDEQIAAIRASEFFQPEQLLVIPAGQEAEAFLGEKKQPNLILIDGAAGRVSAPFAGDGAPDAVEFAAAEPDLASIVLDVLAALPKGETEPKTETSE